MFTPSKHYNLSSRKILSTQAFETERENFENEYAEFIGFEQSQEFLRLKELNSWVEAKEPERIKRELSALKYKKSEEYQLESEFIKISKSSVFRDYLKHTKSGLPEFFNGVKNSGKIEELAELESFVSSSEYKSNRGNYKKENSAEYQKEVQYNTLKANADVRKYQKLQKDKSLQNYFNIADSDTLRRYNELQSKVESAEFIEKKKFLQSSDKFKKSEAFAMLAERKQLQNSPKIKWFEKTKKSNKFGCINDWRLTFEDNFNEKSLDEQKWLSKFFWGDKLINQSYSFNNNGQNYTDHNFEFTGNSIKIATRNEKSEGLAWDSKFGFVPKSFNYTSGTINTGKSHRQSSGQIEARVRLKCAQGVYHSMYLVGDKMLPQITVFNKFGTDSTNIEAGFYNPKGKKIDKRIKTVKNIDLNSDSYIFSVEWDTKKIYWAINGSIFKTEKNIAKDMPLYMVFASGIAGQVNESALPATMEIDWVKCWEK